jgi:transcriptional regulator with XRE-family HTH domain
LVVGTPSAPRSLREELGTALARLRKAQKITGVQLAKLVDMSQPKISRLENGVGLPDPVDVERIARALGAGEAQVGRLVEMAEQAHDRMMDWRSLWATLASAQQELRQIETQARTLREFQSAIVAGLLQTSEYARAVLSSFRPFVRSGDKDDVVAVPEAVSARVQRQEILGDPTREFHFVMTETVLGNRVCPPEPMAAQLRRIREVSKQENVTVGIIPAGTTWTVPPMHAFAIFDEQAVMIDLLNTGITSQGRADVRTYGQAFRAFQEQATTDIDPILDQYLERYLDEAHPRRRR